MNAFAMLMSQAKERPAGEAGGATKRKAPSSSSSGSSSATKASPHAAKRRAAFAGMAALFSVGPALPGRFCEHIAWNRSSGLPTRCPKVASQDDPFRCLAHREKPSHTKKGPRTPAHLFASAVALAAKEQWAVEVSAVEVPGRPWTLRLDFVDRLGQRRAGLLYDKRRELVVGREDDEGRQLALTRDDIDGCRGAGFDVAEPFDWAEL